MKNSNEKIFFYLFDRENENERSKKIFASFFTHFKCSQNDFKELFTKSVLFSLDKNEKDRKIIDELFFDECQNLIIKSNF
jgi:hypothetical protein